jgi:single-strand DNA-binding protein
MTAPARAERPHDDAAPEHLNEVRLVGRLAAAPEIRELPSGAVVVTFRLVVERRTPRRGAPSRTPTVDTLDCAAWRKDLQRRVSAADPGEVIEVAGALRRRFWRVGPKAASRSEVEVSALRRLRGRAGRAEARSSRG